MTQPSLRERRRTAATQEIVDAAERHIAEHGPAPCPCGPSPGAWG